MEPDNAALLHCGAWSDRVDASDQRPTLPSSIALERQINPFLRSRQAAVKASARRFDPTAHNDVSDFAALREWKNQFR